MHTMEEMFSIVGYHATDEKFVDNIIKDNFTFKPNNKHWLGNGVYFFTDQALANYWATNPTQSFGTNIVNPAIIKTKLSCPYSQIIDLRKLAEFKEHSSAVDEYIKRIGGIRKEINCSKEVLRCSYFDSIKKLWEKEGKSLTMIIAHFYKRNPEYMSGDSNRICVSLIYSEEQVCVFNNNAITDRERVV